MTSADANATMESMSERQTAFHETGSADAPNATMNQSDQLLPLDASPPRTEAASTIDVSPVTVPQLAQETTIESPSTAPQLVEISETTSQYRPYRPHDYRPMSSALSQADTRAGSMWLASPVPGDDGKEVVIYHANASAKLEEPTFNASRDECSDPPVLANKEKRICGIRAKLFRIVVVPVLSALLVFLIIGLSLGLTLARRSDEPNVNGTQALLLNKPSNPSFESTSGAMNGSGIAFAGAVLGSTERGLYTVYYQHYSGDIRYVQLSNEQKFQGGTASETVARDAKSKTPISVVHYDIKNEQVWHVFYVGKDSFVKQRTWRTNGGIWQDGPLNAQELQVLDADSIALQACFYPNFPDEPFQWSHPAEDDEELQEKGMWLFFAKNETTIEQYGIFEQQQRWERFSIWKDRNVHAGVGCFTWETGSTVYLMMVNQTNAINMYWRDTNRTAEIDHHPAFKWRTAPEVAILDVHPTTRLGYTVMLYATLPDATMKYYNISFDAEDSTILGYAPLETANGPVEFLNSTQMSVSAIRTSSGGDDLLVFAQMEGDDITLFKRDLKSGIWTSDKLPVDKD